MITGLQEIDTVGAEQADHAVFLGQAPRPDAGGQILKRLRFADVGEGIAKDANGSEQYQIIFVSLS
jgi:hypothetical protein